MLIGFDFGIELGVAEWVVLVDERSVVEGPGLLEEVVAVAEDVDVDVAGSKVVGAVEMQIGCWWVSSGFVPRSKEC